MATIYLKHPVHGVKVATMELEAQHDEQHGWTRVDSDAVTGAGPLGDDNGSPLNTMPRRRGRPRIHKED